MSNAYKQASKYIDELNYTISDMTLEEQLTCLDELQVLVVNFCLELNIKTYPMLFVGVKEPNA